MAKKPYVMEWYGSDELLRELKKAGGNVNLAISQALEEAFQPIKKDLHQFTGQDHKKSGDTEKAYYESDFYKWSKKNNLNIKVGYNVKDGGEAAIFLQVGTPKMAPYFFITSAYHDHEMEVMTAQQDALEKVVKDMLKKVPSKG